VAQFGCLWKVGLFLVAHLISNMAKPEIGNPVNVKNTEAIIPPLGVTRHVFEGNSPSYIEIASHFFNAGDFRSEIIEASRYKFILLEPWRDRRYGLDCDAFKVLRKFRIYLRLGEFARNFNRVPIDSKPYVYGGSSSMVPVSHQDGGILVRSIKGDFSATESDPSPLLPVKIIHGGIEGSFVRSGLAVIAPNSFSESSTGNTNGVLSGSGSSSHLRQLTPVNPSDKRINRKGEYANSNQVYLASSNILCPFWGITFMVLGIAISGCGWYAIVSTRLEYRQESGNLVSVLRFRRNSLLAWVLFLIEH
jgi:hypothetical protein